MVITRRFVVLSLITALSIGAGTWVTVRYLRKPVPGTATASGGAAGASAGDARHIKATLYYIATDGVRLEGAEREVAFGDGTAEQARRILEALTLPAPAGLTSALPPQTALRGVYVTDTGAAYVDFTNALRANHPGGSLTEILTVYAIVSSLTVNLPAITSVQILIDGHEVDTLAGHVDLRRPLPRAPQWMEKGPA